MGLVPRVGENQVVGPDQLEVSAGGGLVNYDLGTSGIYDAAVYQGSVNIVESHGAFVGAGYAPELQGVALGLGHVYVLETLGSLANDFEKGARVALFVQRLRPVLWRVRVCILR